MTEVRADIVDVYVFRRATAEVRTVHLLQMRRTGEPMRGTWQPVMGHTEPGETAAACARRELAEETGLDVRGREARRAWALELVHPYYIASIDAVIMGPRFAVEVSPSWEPVLNAEHDAHRWVPIAWSERDFLWPGQRAAIREIAALLAGDPSEAMLRVEL